LDARPAGVLQADEGSAYLHGEIHDLDHFVTDGPAEAAAEHREVFREDEHRAAVNRTEPGDYCIAGRTLLLDTEAGSLMPDKHVDFLK
jgi:hypothetical protein